MSIQHIDRLRVVSDDGTTTVNLMRIGDETLGQDTWLVDYNGKNYPIEGYDAAITDADSLLGEIAKALPAVEAATAAVAILDATIDAKRDANTPKGQPVVPNGPADRGL